MKFLKFLLIAAVLFSSCSSSKKAVYNTVSIKKMSAKKVARNHVAALLDKQTIEAKLRVVYKSSKKKQKLTIKLRIEKDKTIWINTTVMGLLVSRAIVTPTSVNYYEKINKTYFKGDFEILKVFLGAEVDFYQLQNLLLGQAVVSLEKTKHKSSVDGNSHLLVPSKQNDILSVLYWVNPVHYKIDQQELISAEKDQLLRINYSKYTSVEGVIFPKTIEVRAKERDTITTIHIEYRSVLFNKELKMPFNIPRSYKRVVLR